MQRDDYLFNGLVCLQLINVLIAYYLQMPHYPQGNYCHALWKSFSFFALKWLHSVFWLLPRVLICGHGQSVFLELLEFVLVDALLIFYLDVFAPLSRQYNLTLGGGFLHNLLFSQANKLVRLANLRRVGIVKAYHIKKKERFKLLGMLEWRWNALNFLSFFKFRCYLARIRH